MEYKLSEKVTNFITDVFLVVAFVIIAIFALAILAGVISVFVLAAKFLWFGATF